jgi:putative ABC transport system permease protein
VFRGLTYFWRLHLAVLLGAAVTAAVLTGSLAVGDSMRAGLRRLWLERLGEIELAAAAPRLFRAELAEAMARRLPAAGGGVVAPLLVLRGTAVHATTERRAPRVAVLGVDQRFAALYPGGEAMLARLFDRRPDGAAGASVRAGAGAGAGALPPLLLNETLARQLAAQAGDDVLLSWEQPSAIPRDLLLAAKDPEALVSTHRFTVAAVLAGSGPGGFDLAPGQATPANAFLPLAALQHELGQDRRANALLVGRPAAGPRAEARDDARPRAAAAALAAGLRLDDLGLTLRPLAAGSAGGTGMATAASASTGAATAARSGRPCLALESRELFLPPAVVDGAIAAAAGLGATAQPVLTYLATGLKVPASHGRDVPYSMVSAFAAPAGPGPTPAGVSAGGPAAPAVPLASSTAAELRLVSGEPAPLPKDDEILLDSWAAEDLAARVGDKVEMSYFLPDSGGAGGPLRTASASFRVRGVVSLAGLAADRGLTPAFPGIDQARDMASWSPPFPLDLSRVRPRDEAFWHLYGPTPKAFVSLAAARRRWQTRFGDLTSLRLSCPPGVSSAALAARYEPRLLARLEPAVFGLALRPVRAEGLRAAAEGTDFGSLFVAFSSFLIASSALLTGLLFRLGLERRAREAGLLLALGYPPATVRRRFLGEGLALSGAGALLGAACAGAYAAPLLARLQRQAGAPRLTFAASPETLAWGALATVATVLLFLAAGTRRMSRLPAARLLAGAVAAGRGEGRRPWWRGLALAAVAAALVLGGVLHAARGGAPVLAFGVSASLLAAGISAFALWCLAAGERDAARGGLLAMGVRNAAANPGRSVLCVALVACACFVLVLVAANRHDGAAGGRGGWGGWNLLAESATPLYQDLGGRDGRGALGFTAEAERLLAGSEIAGLAEVPGDDASCLNLYRPRRPRLLGVPPRLARQRFALAAGEGSVADLFAGAAAPPAPPGDSGGAAPVPAVGDEQWVRWILHLGIGDEMTVAGDGGAPVRLRIVGLLAGSPLQGALLIPERELAARFPRHGGHSVFLIRTPPGREAEVAGLLARQLRDFGFAVTPVAERLRLYARVEDTYLASFQALGSLGLLLGTGGLAVVLLRNVVERRGELAALRAFGFRRSRLAGLLLLENASLLALGVALGTAAGLLPEALGAGVAGSFPWLPLAATLAAVLLAGLLASALAVAGALAAPLLPALEAE